MMPPDRPARPRSGRRAVRVVLLWMVVVALLSLAATGWLSGR